MESATWVWHPESWVIWPKPPTNLSVLSRSPILQTHYSMSCLQQHLFLQVYLLKCYLFFKSKLIYITSSTKPLWFYHLQWISTTVSLCTYNSSTALFLSVIYYFLRVFSAHLKVPWVQNYVVFINIFPTINISSIYVLLVMGSKRVDAYIIYS